MTGNLGIGTNNPTQALHVQGNLNVTGEIYGHVNKTSDIPSGAVMFFNLASCPTGWSESSVFQGRYLVGKPNNGTLGATVGTALTDKENRNITGNHTLTTAEMPAHQHLMYSQQDFDTKFAVAFLSGAAQTPAGTGGAFAFTNDNPSTGLTGGNGPHNHNISSVAGTNAPYIQLLVCQKN